MNHPRNSTKSAVLWRVIIARSYHKIYHYFVNLRHSAVSAPSLPFNTPSVCLRGWSTVRL